MTITGGSALSKDDIDRMVREAEQYAEEDRRRRESIETRNQAEQLVYTTEKFLTDNDDKIPAEVKDEVKADVESLKKALEDTGDDAASAIDAAVAKLGESSQKMGAAMYAASAAQGEPGSPAGDDLHGEGRTDDEVVDAEIVDDEGDQK
jgi:molecular chaperone DnaK